MKEIISTNKAPAAIGPYSQAVKAGEFLYVSGQIPVNPRDGEILPSKKGFVADQTRLSLENLKAIIEAAGYSMSDVIKTTVFITDMNDFAKVNEIYARYFEKDPPARACVAVKELPKGAMVEIEAVAWKQEKKD